MNEWWRVLGSDGFMPHGMCYLWRPDILGLHVVSDALITLSYFSIPFTLLYFARKRRDLHFGWVLLCFAAFIVACGTSHLMEIVTIWYPAYWLSGGVKAVTALASVPTAILLVKLVPVALRMPSPAALEAANAGLAHEVAERRVAEAQVRRMNESLEALVAERTAQLRTLNAELETRVLARTAELKERDALLQEIHHRVKNNLQVISSLISMQVRTIEDASTRAALQQCSSRVETMAQIHEMLYLSKDYANVPFGKYARELATRVLGASGASPEQVAIGYDLEEVFLPVDKAIPCALILNELISNALKHAFPEGRGAIRVELRLLAGGRVLLSVSDDGIGIRGDFDPARSKSLGVQLVIALTRQLDGELNIERQPGASFRIAFPFETPHAERNPA